MFAKSRACVCWCSFAAVLVVAGGCDRFRSPQDDNRPPFINVQTILPANIPVDRVGALDITVSAVPTGPGLPLSNTFQLEQSEEGKPQVFLRAQPEPNDPSRRELVISYGGNPFRNGARTVELFLYPIFGVDGGSVTPEVTMKARLLTSTGAVMAIGEIGVDTTGAALVFGGERDRTAQLIMSCVPGGPCFGEAVRRAASLTVTRAERCPVGAARGSLYAILVSTDEVTARRLWFRQDAVDFTNPATTVTMAFDVPIGGYTVYVVLDTGDDLLQTNLAPQRGDFVSTVAALQVNLDRETQKAMVLDQVIGVGNCLGAAEFLPPVITGTTPPSPSNVARPFVTGVANEGDTVTLFSDDTCTTALTPAFVVTGSGGDFSVQIAAATPLAPNTTTPLHARAVSAAGRVSACSPATTAAEFVNDATQPTMTGGLTAAASPVAATIANLTFAPGVDPPASTNAARTPPDRLRYQACATLSSTGAGCLGGAFAVFGTATGGGAPVSIAVGGLQPSTRYHFFARALDEAGNAGAPIGPAVLRTGSASTSSIARVALGARHTCVLVAGGDVQCFGANDAGQLGTAAGERIVSGASPALALAAGSKHTCAIVASSSVPARPHRVVCWGDNSLGQLGVGDTQPRTGPQQVLEPTQSEAGFPTSLGAPRLIAAGDAHTCVANAEGFGFCWGDNGADQLTQPAAPIAPRVATRPVSIFATSTPRAPLRSIHAIEAGGRETCVLTADGNNNLGSRACWGDNSRRQVSPTAAVAAPLPTTPGNAGIGSYALSVGSLHACHLDSTGRIRCSGRSTDTVNTTTFGVLGDGSTTYGSTSFVTPFFAQRISPVMRAVAAGDLNTCSIDPLGALHCWGMNDNGQLGDGTPSLTPRTSPLQISTPLGSSGPPNSSLGGVTLAAASRGDHSCVIDGAGALHCWGKNDAGQLGLVTPAPTAPATVTNSPVPRPALNLSTAAQTLGVSMGGAHACARFSDGTVSCWGNNQLGQLGNGAAEGSAAPLSATSVVGLARETGVLSVAAGTDSTCVVTGEGRVRCWGAGGRGQLGEGVRLGSAAPGIVAGLIGATQVSIGGEFACALNAAGAVACWGNNDFGQLGAGFVGDETLPSFVINGNLPTPTNLANVVEVAAGTAHACARDGVGVVHCWGSNSGGQLGVNQITTTRNSAQAITGIGNRFAQIAAGGEHSCGVNVDGAVFCWGKNDKAQLGDGTLVDRGSSVAVVGHAARAVAVAAGAKHSCALMGDGTVDCWGDNSFGQARPFAVGGVVSPPGLDAISSPPGGAGIAAVTAGGNTTCALHANGKVTCWGDGAAVGRAVTTMIAPPGFVDPLP